MYDRILVATDGSENAADAIDEAVALADGTGASLHGIYAIETRTAYDNAIVDPDEVERTLREDGEEALAVLDERAAEAGIEAETAIRKGVPHEEILDYAADHGVDLIVIGATGRSAFKTVLLGSTAERVLRQAAVPVLVVGTEEDGAPDE
ncbi:universal stress protein [Natronomonas amylolytica]|uniref:universal stress protein n=1 Tax=Natronomonas amylolytica TaxID=3108498 RepID=UPI0030091E2A